RPPRLAAGTDRVTHNPAPLVNASLHDAIRQMGDGGRLDYSGALELHRPGVEVVEQPDTAAAEQQRGDVDAQLVEEAGAEVLLDDVGAARNRDVLVARGRPSLLERRLDPVGDERERGPSLLGDPLPCLV